MSLKALKKGPDYKASELLQVCGIHEELDGNSDARFHVRGIFFRAFD